jgi:hypothetical protein
LSEHQLARVGPPVVLAHKGGQTVVPLALADADVDVVILPDGSAARGLTDILPLVELDPASRHGCCWVWRALSVV